MQQLTKNIKTTFSLHEVFGRSPCRRRKDQIEMKPLNLSCSWAIQQAFRFQLFESCRGSTLVSCAHVHLGALGDQELDGLVSDSSVTASDCGNG